MRGHSLFTVLIFTVVVSIILVAITKAQNQFLIIKQDEKTETSLNDVFASLNAYYSINGHYPCPAPINVSFDNDKFGFAANNCMSSSNGVSIITGENGDLIAQGAVPVRTLGIPDHNAFDAGKKYFQYTVTSNYTIDETDELPHKAAIQLVDRNNNQSTVEKVIFTVFSFSKENKGAYSSEGKIIENCDSSSYFGENCDGDDFFTHTAELSDVGKNLYSSKIRYEAEKPCRKKGAFPKRLGFLVDTSGSMNYKGFCPPGSDKKNCSRMDGAVWALRHAMSARFIQHKISDEELFTGLSGFTFKVHNRLQWIFGKKCKESCVYSRMSPSKIEIDSEEKFYKNLSKMCPGGGTPLGTHIWAMARRIGDGTEAQPNSIIVFADGDNTGFMSASPTHYAQKIRSQMPNLRVNIIDLTNTSSLKNVAEITEGQYYRVSKPDDFVTSIYKSMGACFDDEIPEIFGDIGHCEAPPSEVFVNVGLDIQIIISDPIKVTGKTQAEVDAALEQAVAAAKNKLNDDVSQALSIALSNAINMNRNGNSSLFNKEAIMDGFNEALADAIDSAMDTANNTINNMPAVMRAPIRKAVGQGVDNVVGQFYGAIEGYVDTTIETGEVPPMTFTATDVVVVPL